MPNEKEPLIDDKILTVLVRVYAQNRIDEQHC